MSNTNYNPPKFRTKIVAGRLVTVPVYETADNISFLGYRNEKNAVKNRMFHAAPSHQQHCNTNFYSDSRHAISNEQSLKQLSNARLEAQRNKTRALEQTYRSVLSPQPEKREISQTHSFLSNPLVAGVVSSIASVSRHRLLSAFSQMRRLDPREDGTLTMYEVEDTMAIHNIYLDTQTGERLFEHFAVGNGVVDYQKMWKFFMDCYACKDQIDIPTKETSKTPYSTAVIHNNISIQEQVGVPPGLYAELEHELRKYARQHQQCLETKLLGEMFHSLDRYGSGRILKSQVHSLCQQYLHGLNQNVLLAVLNICDVEQSGLINYQKFLKLISECQPTYLPPISKISRSLISSDESSAPCSGHYHKTPSIFTDRNGYVNDRKQLLDYLQTLSTPPNKEHHGYSGMNVEYSDDIPSGNSKQLEEIGNVGLHLSDFETQVHSRKSLIPSTDAPEDEEPVKRPGTYDLTPKRNDRKEIHFTKSASQGSSQRIIKNHKPNIRSQPRKEWSKKSGDKNKHAHVAADKVDKWWKKEELGVCSEGEDKFDKINNRKTWGQSNRIRTVKSKRKKKTFKKLLNKANNKDDTTSSATDSEFYTTTDVEINDEPSIRRLILTTDDENNGKSLCGKTKLEPVDTPVNRERMESKNPEQESSKDDGRQILKAFEKGEKRDSPLNVTENLRTAIETVRTESDEKKEQEISKGNIQNLTDKIGESLQIESCSPKAEECSLILNGHTYLLHPSFDDLIYNVERETSRTTQKLQLEWVYGCESPVFLVTSEQFVFYAGKVVVVMHSSKLEQRFFRKHTSNVSAICVDTKEMICASAQEWDGRKCVVYIWSIIDMATMTTIHVDQKKMKDTRIPVMAFITVDKKDSYLLVLFDSRDLKDQHICLYDIKDNEMKTSIEISNVIGMVVSPLSDGGFATFGKNGHLYLHQYKNDSINSRRASHGDMPVAKTITCAVINNNGDVITGDSNGTIYMWLCSCLRIDHAIHNAHASSVSAMCVTKKGFVFSGSSKHPCVKVWDAHMHKLNEDFELPYNCVGIKSMSLLEESMILGCVSNTISRINLSTSSVVNSLCFEEESFNILTEGHSDVVTFIAHDPMYTEMLTSVSADGWLYMYNTNTNSTVCSARVQGNGSCLVYHPLKEFLFVGCQDGSIHMLNSTTGTFIDKFKDVFSCITCLQFSKEENLLSCGTRDGDLLIYMFDHKAMELELMKVTKIFEDGVAVHNIDWDDSRLILRIQSSINTLKYYNIEESLEIEDNPRTHWDANNCSISYETKGLWSMMKDCMQQQTSPIFCVSSSKNIMAHITAEKLCLLKYPSTKIEETTHALYTTSGCYSMKSPGRICFSCDGSKLYIVYDKTSCLWQWKVLDDT